MLYRTLPLLLALGPWVQDPGTTTDPRDAATSADATASSRAAARPSQDEPVERICRQLVAEAYQGSSSAFTAVYDAARVRDFALRDLDPTSAQLAFADGVLERMDPWSEVLRIVDAGGDVQFLRATPEEGSTVALLRLTLGPEFDYHRYRFVRGAGGAPAIVDVFRLSEGDSLTSMLADLVRACPADGGRPPLLDALATLADHVEAEDAPGGLRALAALPPELRTHPDVMRAWVELARLQGPEEWAAAIDEFERTFPQRTDALYMRLALGLEEEDEAAQRDAIARLLKETHDPAFAEYLRGHLALEVEEWDAARDHLQRALGFQPSYEDPLWDLLVVHQEAGDFASYARVLERLEFRFGYTFEDLRSDPTYEAFVLSDAFDGWNARREARLKQRAALQTTPKSKRQRSGGD